MPDLEFQQFSTVQNQSMPAPTTIATAATIAPTTALTFITGTIATVANITPPVSGFHVLFMVASTGAVMNITGNILNAATAVSNVPFLMIYNPVTRKYSAMV